jgi:Tfp pilus assembly protein PilN
MNEISPMADFWLTRVRAGSRVERRLHMQVPSRRRNLMYIGIGTVVLIIIIVLVVLMLRRR